jgi:hypothetical protein
MAEGISDYLTKSIVIVNGLSSYYKETRPIEGFSLINTEITKENANALWAKALQYKPVQAIKKPTKETTDIISKLENKIKLTRNCVKNQTLNHIIKRDDKMSLLLYDPSQLLPSFLLGKHTLFKRFIPERFKESKEEVFNLAKNKSNYTAIYETGIICFIEGTYKEAIEKFEKIKKYMPTNDLLIWLGLAYFYQYIKDKDKKNIIKSEKVLLGIDII